MYNVCLVYRSVHKAGSCANNCFCRKLAHGSSVDDQGRDTDASFAVCGAEEEVHCTHVYAMYTCIHVYTLYKQTKCSYNVHMYVYVPNVHACHVCIMEVTDGYVLHMYAYSS